VYKLEKSCLQPVFDNRGWAQNYILIMNHLRLFYGRQEVILQSLLNPSQR